MNDDKEKIELSLEGILQAIANVNLEDDINFDISELLKGELDEIIKKDEKVLKLEISRGEYKDGMERLSNRR